MVLMRYEPWGVFDRLNRHIGQVFGDSVSNTGTNGAALPTWGVSVDVQEEADKFVVRADLPGIESKDIQITAENGVLTLSGERKFERSEEQKGYARFERVEGRFERRFTLPENVNTDLIRARHLNGVLEVTIPKAPTPEPKRVSVETH